MVLQREFFQRDTVLVAKELLGKKLIRRIGNKKCIGEDALKALNVNNKMNSFSALAKLKNSKV